MELKLSCGQKLEVIEIIKEANKDIMNSINELRNWLEESMENKWTMALKDCQLNCVDHRMEFTRKLDNIEKIKEGADEYEAKLLSILKHIGIFILKVTGWTMAILGITNIHEISKIIYNIVSNIFKLK